MNSITLTVPPSGLHLHITNKGSSAQIVLVLPDGAYVEEQKANPSVTEQNQKELFSFVPISPVVTGNGFPPRELTEATIIEILREHGGSVKINDKESGWRIYDEIAARLGVTIDARRRLTARTQEPAWRPEVGFARKNLEQKGVLQPTEVSTRGVWALTEKYRVKS